MIRGHNYLLHEANKRLDKNTMHRFPGDCIVFVGAVIIGVVYVGLILAGVV